MLRIFIWKSTLVTKLRNRSVLLRILYEFLWVLLVMILPCYVLDSLHQLNNILVSSVILITIVSIYITSGFKHLLVPTTSLDNWQTINRNILCITLKESKLYLRLHQIMGRWRSCDVSGCYIRAPTTFLVKEDKLHVYTQLGYQFKQRRQNRICEAHFEARFILGYSA